MNIPYGGWKLYVGDVVRLTSSLIGMPLWIFLSPFNLGAFGFIIFTDIIYFPLNKSVHLFIVLLKVMLNLAMGFDFNFI